MLPPNRLHPFPPSFPLLKAKNTRTRSQSRGSQVMFALAGLVFVGPEKHGDL